MRFPRFLKPRLLAALKSHPVVFLEGPRQAGKSTLAMAVAEDLGLPYYTLDDLDLLAAATADPRGLLAQIGDRAVLDEVQRAPELLLALKAEVDRDRRPGRYLLTGSANVLALPRVAEALVGRMAVLTLWPLSQGEIERKEERFLDLVFAARPPLSWPPAREWQDRVARGGFPPAVMLDRNARKEWFAGYVRTLLERDVRDLASVEQVALLRDLLVLLAERTGSLLNTSELARTLGRPRSTVEKYLRLFERLFIVLRLPAWAKSATRRLTRSPKVFLADSGLAAFLMARPNWGALLETFVFTEVAKQVARRPDAIRLYHYRDRSGREVDLVLEGPFGVVGIEVKTGLTPTAADFKGLKRLAEDAGSAFAHGYLLYPGERALPFGERLWALPLSALWA